MGLSHAPTSSHRRPIGRVLGAGFGRRLALREAHQGVGDRAQQEKLHESFCHLATLCMQTASGPQFSIATGILLKPSAVTVGPPLTSKHHVMAWIGPIATTPGVRPPTKLSVQQ